MVHCIGCLIKFHVFTLPIYLFSFVPYNILLFSGAYSIILWKHFQSTLIKCTVVSVVTLSVTYAVRLAAYMGVASARKLLIMVFELCAF